MGNLSDENLARLIKLLRVIQEMKILSKIYMEPEQFHDTIDYYVNDLNERIGELIRDSALRPVSEGGKLPEDPITNILNDTDRTSSPTPSPLMNFNILESDRLPGCAQFRVKTSRKKTQLFASYVVTDNKFLLEPVQEYMKSNCHVAKNKQLFFRLPKKETKVELSPDGILSFCFKESEETPMIFVSLDNKQTEQLIKHVPSIEKNAIVSATYWFSSNTISFIINNVKPANIPHIGTSHIVTYQ